MSVRDPRPEDWSNNNQCPQCHDYPEYRGACGVCEGTGTQPQSREQTKATIGDSTQNAVQPQESTKDPMPCSFHVIPNCYNCEPKEAKKKHPQSSEGGGNLPTANDTTVEEAKPADSLRRNIGILRQWLNEDRIKEAKYFVTNEDLEHWLFWESRSEATAVSHDTNYNLGKHKSTKGMVEAPLPKEVSPDTIKIFKPCCDACGVNTPSKSTDIPHAPGCPFEINGNCACWMSDSVIDSVCRGCRRGTECTPEAPTSSDGQAVSEDTMPLDEITSILIEYGEACYDHSGNTTHRRVAKERIQSLISSEKVKELKAIYDYPTTPSRGIRWSYQIVAALEKRIKELESD